jgi:hypothetical protein
MSKSAEDVRPAQAVKALALMERALGLLDEVETSAEVAAHLDLAICRLRDWLAPIKSGGSPSERQNSASPPKRDW